MELELGGIATRSGNSVLRKERGARAVNYEEAREVIVSLQKLKATNVHSVQSEGDIGHYNQFTVVANGNGSDSWPWSRRRYFHSLKQFTAFKDGLEP